MTWVTWVGLGMGKGWKSMCGGDSISTGANNMSETDVAPWCYKRMDGMVNQASRQG